MTPEMARGDDAEHWHAHYDAALANWQECLARAEAALALAERKAEGAQLKAEQFGAVADDEYRKRRDVEDVLAIAVGLKDASEAKNTDLRAALALQAQERQWQPIETAPKDGTRVDLCAKSWLPAFDRFESQRFANCYWWAGDSMTNNSAKWIELPRDWHATHWMPLPSLPSAAAPVKAEKL